MVVQSRSDEHGQDAGRDGLTMQIRRGAPQTWVSTSDGSIPAIAWLATGAIGIAWSSLAKSRGPRELCRLHADAPGRRIAPCVALRSGGAGPASGGGLRSRRDGC